MKKITFLLTLLLTCVLGAYAADFTPVSGAKYLIKCKGDSKYVLWNSSCVKSADDNTVVLSNWAQFDYRSVFIIEGNATDGYTIRSAKDNTQYVYAINTNDDEDGNVGVKSVEGTPGDECKWKIVQQGDGWNIIAKGGNYSWNNRGSYNGNAHVGTWNNNGADNDIWYIQTPVEMAEAITTTTGTTVGSVSETYKTDTKAKAQAFITSGTEADFNTFKSAFTNPGAYVNLTTGFYRMKNAETGTYNSYLFNDMLHSFGQTHDKTLGNVPDDADKAHNNYIWKVTRGELPAATATILNGQGVGINLGSNIAAPTLGLSDFYTDGYIYFTNGIHLSNQSHLTVKTGTNANAEATKTNPFVVTNWSYTNSKGSAYTFEAVDMSGLTEYTVSITGGEASSYVKLTSTNEVAKNGGFFLLSSAPSASDFTCSESGIYDGQVTIDGTTIKVTYVENYDRTLAQVEATAALSGIGYPIGEARTTLANAIATAKSGEHTSAVAKTLLAAETAYKNSTSVQLPEDGHSYVFTNVNISGAKKYLNYAEDGLITVDRGDAEANSLPQSAKFTCRIDNGKYIFVNNEGKYLIWKGKETADGGNSNKGYTDSYDADYSTLTVARNTKVFGCLSFGGKRNNTGTPNSYFIVKKDGTFDRAGFDDFNSADYSSAFTFEEVNYANKVTFNSTNGSVKDVDYIATFSAPFATVKPANVKAYYVGSVGEKASMVEITSDAIPANEGVILASTSADAVYMTPATTETAEAITGNKLGNTAGAEKAMTLGEGYILANGTNGVAFYASAAGTLSMNKAYLLATGNAAIALDFGTVSGINAIAVENTDNAAVYDLTGRKVKTATKGGVYIQNGRKFIVK